MKTPSATARTILLAAGLLASAACGQQPPAPGLPPPPPATVQMQPPAAPASNQVFPPAPAGPKFEPLGRKDASGKIIPISGVIDAHAILRNPLIDDETRARIAPVVEDWQADVNQLAIDNLDFLEKIDQEGLIDKLDFNNNDQLRFISQVMVPFISAGPLTSRLTNKGALTGEQGNLNTTISNDYFQSCFNEVMADQGGIDPLRVDDAPEKQKEKIDKVNKLTHFLYYMTCRDARESYHRLMVESAPIVDQVIADMGLSAEDLGKVQPGLAAVKQASTVDEKREAVRALIKPLTFEQRRTYLQKAMNRGCNKNPVEIVKQGMPRA